MVFLFSEVSLNLLGLVVVVGARRDGFRHAWRWFLLGRDRRGIGAGAIEDRGAFPRRFTAADDRGQNQR